MIARAQLTVLDFNAEVRLKQKKKLRFKHQFSKITQSWVIKKIKEKYAYKNHNLDEIKNIQSTSIIYETSKLENVPKYIGGVTKENKRKQHQSLT